MAFLLLVQVKCFWAVANKTHLSVIRGALVVFQVAVTRVCPPRPDRRTFRAALAREGTPADKSHGLHVKVKVLTLRHHT